MRLYQVDAFTEQPFKGNPAAVCLLEKDMPDVWMQNVAMEMNLSETAFLLPEKDGFRLRWFTPLVEVDLCGHATLASAQVLFETGILANSEIACFYTRSGLLQAVNNPDGIELNFPATPPQPAEPLPGLLEALALQPVYIGRSKFDYLLQVESEEQVRDLQPDYIRLRQVTARGVMVTSRSNEFDFVSRFFAPAVGVDEDPVTGSAHCCLAPFWSERLGKTFLRACQVSQRSGILSMTVEGDRVRLQGKAKMIFKGELLV